MRRRCLISSGLLAVAVALIAFAAPAAAQDGDWTLPRTPDGHPDLQGVWANNNATPLERPAEWEGRDRLTDEELAELKAAAAQAVDDGDALFGDQLVLAAIERTKATSYDPTTGNYNQFWIAERDFNDRTSLVVDPSDGRVPALTASARDRQGMLRAHRRDHPADGTPALDDDVRLWHGDSRGHWEGDTLVVQTANYSPQATFRGLSSEHLRVTEHFTRVGPQTLNYEVTIDDPTTYTRPWTALIPLMGTTDAIYEYACHEGNIGMDGILSGHRVEEREAAAGSK